MSSARTWIDRWIFDAYTATPEGLALYRITYALFVLLFVAPGHSEYASFTAFASFPDALFLPPPGPMQLVSGFPPEAFFETLHGLIVLSVVAVLFGFYTRTASVATTLLFLVGYGFSYSLGKINHNILIVLLPLLMASSNWGAAYSFDARAGRTSRAVASWPLVLVMLCTGFAMFTAGFPKILGGWLDPSTQAAQGRLVHEFFVQGRQDLLAPLAVSLDAPVLWEVFDVATVLFEVGFLFAAFHPLATRLFVVGAVGFHTGVMLILNIAFLPNFIVYAAVLPWPRIARALSSFGAAPLPAPSSRASASTPFDSLRRVGIVVATTLFFFLVGSPLLWLDGIANFRSDLTILDVTVVGLAWVCLAVALVLTFGRRSSHPKTSSSS